MDKSVLFIVVIIIILLFFLSITIGYFFIINNFLNNVINDEELLQEEINKKGVYFINNSSGFNYDQAKKKCKQYNGRLADPELEFKKVAERDNWFTCQYGWTERKNGKPESVMYNDKNASGCPIGFSIQNNPNKNNKLGVYCYGFIPNEALTYSIY